MVLNHHKRLTSFQEIQTPGHGMQPFENCHTVTDSFIMIYLLIVSVLYELLHGNEISQITIFKEFFHVRQWQEIHFPNLSCFLSESVSKAYIAVLVCITKVMSP